MVIPYAVGKGAPIISADLDGTTIHSNGNVHEDVAAAIARLARSGALLVFNSNTSLDGLRRHVLRMGVSLCHVAGWVAENGALIRPGASSLIPSDNLAPNFEERSAQFEAFRMIVHQWCRDTGCDVVFTHPATTVRSLNGYSPWVHKVAFIDDTRRVSYSCEVRAVVNGEFRITRKIMGEFGGMHRQIAEQVWGAEGLTADGYPRPEWEIDGGFVDIASFDVDKAASLHALVALGHPTYHIGDGRNELCTANVPGVVTIAVGNRCSFGRSGKAHAVTAAHGPDGFIEAVISGTPEAGRGYRYLDGRAYGEFIIGKRQ